MNTFSAGYQQALLDMAEASETLRRVNPMNGDASNLMLDHVHRELVRLAKRTVGGGMDAAVEAQIRRTRVRIKFEANEEYEATYGNPEWQAAQRLEGA